MFYYKVEFWDEIESRNTTEQGLTDADTYGKAADKVQEYYGKDKVVTISLTEFEDILTLDDLRGLL